MKENITKHERSSNFELFRVIAMLLIISSHYISGSGVETKIMEMDLSKNVLTLFFLGAWGQMGINCFVLITGYFMCKQKATVKKFFKLLFEIEFYKIIIYIIMFYLGYETLTFERIIRILSPIADVNYGFVTAFLFFYLFIPFINILISNMNKKQHLQIVLLSIFLYSIWDYFPFFRVSLNYVSWFITLYFISSYIRMYPTKIRLFKSSYFWGAMAFINIALSYISIYYYIPLHTPYRLVNGANAILALSTAFTLFMFFKNIKIRQNKLINIMGASTFGVLLIHANSNAMRQWLWVDTLKNVEHISDPHLLLRALIIIFSIFIICVTIDQIRIHFIEKPFLNTNIYNKISEIIQNKLD